MPPISTFHTVLQSSNNSSNKPAAPVLRDFSEELPTLATRFEPLVDQTRVNRLREVCIHANVTITAMRGDAGAPRNVTRNYFSYRLWRVWDASIDPTTVALMAQSALGHSAVCTHGPHLSGAGRG